LITSSAVSNLPSKLNNIWFYPVAPTPNLLESILTAYNVIVVSISPNISNNKQS